MEIIGQRGLGKEAIITSDQRMVKNIRFNETSTIHMSMEYQILKTLN